MKSDATNTQEYLQNVPLERQEAFFRLRKTILDNLPEGFIETFNYGMIGYVVPFAIYPKGYHCDPKQALPFINLASQKNYIALYHLGIYTDPNLLEWFVAAYPDYVKHKLDMGKSCIRFKKIDQIPYELIGELVKKISVAEWIKCYENSLKK